MPRGLSAADRGKQAHGKNTNPGDRAKRVCESHHLASRWPRAERGQIRPETISRSSSLPATIRRRSYFQSATNSGRQGAGAWPAEERVTSTKRAQSRRHATNRPSAVRRKMRASPTAWQCKASPSLTSRSLHLSRSNSKSTRCTITASPGATAARLEGVVFCIRMTWLKSIERTAFSFLMHLDSCRFALPSNRCAASAVFHGEAAFAGDHECKGGKCTARRCSRRLPS